MQKIFLFILLVFPLLLQAQIGGERVYGFINLPASSRVTSTGGSYITVKDHDPGLAFHNPSLLNASMHNRFSAATAIYFAGINFGNFNYVRHYDSIGTFQAGLTYVTYGNFQQTDVTGQVTGEFKASEYVLNVGGAYDYEKYTFGGNVKYILSQFESFRSHGAALDIAASYHDTSKLFTATLVVKNIGLQFKPYYPGNREPIPFEIQAGFSKRFKHLPFRISVILHDLQSFNLRYEDPNLQQTGSLFSTDTVEQKNSAGDVLDEIARHVIFAGEFYFGKAVIFGFGYNHQRRQEMRFEGRRGLAGFSFGMTINIKQFSFGYARARHFISDAANHFTVGLNLNEFTKKKQVAFQP